MLLIAQESNEVEVEALWMRARTLKQPRTEVHWSRKFAGTNSLRLIFKKNFKVLSLRDRQES